MGTSVLRLSKKSVEYAAFDSKNVRAAYAVRCPFEKTRCLSKVPVEGSLSNRYINCPVELFGSTY